jgi:glutamate synthase (NADPH) large chain
MTGGIVVVLGETGSNFAAGMSGGVAFVLDESGGFQQRCNLAMVDLEPLADEDEHLDEHLEAHGAVDVVRSLTQSDSRLLHRLIARHASLTQSPKAKEILAGWEQYRLRFVKVMPVEYRRALQQMQARARTVERPGVGVAVGAAE